MSTYIFFDLRPSILLGSVKSWVFFFFKSIQSYEYFIWSSLKVCLITMAILALNLPRGADSLVRIFLLSTLQWIKKIFYRHQKVLVTPCTIKQYYWSSVWTDIYIYRLYPKLVKYSRTLTKRFTWAKKQKLSRLLKVYCYHCLNHIAIVSFCQASFLFQTWSSQASKNLFNLSLNILYAFLS